MKHSNDNPLDIIYRNGKHDDEVICHVLQNINPNDTYKTRFLKYVAKRVKWLTESVNDSSDPSYFSQYTSTYWIGVSLTSYLKKHNVNGIGLLQNEYILDAFSKLNNCFDKNNIAHYKTISIFNRYENMLSELMVNLTLRGHSVSNFDDFYNTLDFLKCGILHTINISNDHEMGDYPFDYILIWASNYNCLDLQFAKFAYKTMYDNGLATGGFFDHLIETDRRCGFISSLIEQAGNDAIISKRISEDEKRIMKIKLIHHTKFINRPFLYDVLYIWDYVLQSYDYDLTSYQDRIICNEKYEYIHLDNAHEFNVMFASEVDYLIFR